MYNCRSWVVIMHIWFLIVHQRNDREIVSFFCFVLYLNHPWSVCPILLRVMLFHYSWNHLLNRLFVLLLCPLLMQPSKLHIVLLCTCRCCKLCVLLGFLVEGRLFICICQVMSWVGHRTHLSFEFVNQLIFSLLYFPLLPFYHMPLACNLKGCKVWSMIFLSFLFGFCFADIRYHLQGAKRLSNFFYTFELAVFGKSMLVLGWCF